VRCEDCRAPRAAAARLKGPWTSELRIVREADPQFTGDLPF
jgi:hypothetical protein